MRKSQTYFDQIPLEVVKKMAEADVAKDDKTGPDNVSLEPASGKRAPDGVPARSLRRKSH
ncbi:MAG: hypothetical protein A3H96_20060 [Acidobacteria bacterium RIFCSPLOWO2_02_FULL_67_36]|nr:MAG: hypothetical protein A3H96_20060 [Acidobacteria bacterium RIFCSPLOWO2_02_FULL_67_36]OFW23335.1 MAG: hypothetical protein A3G21_10565 [Acidobacteria bacterium RIFCSPLOWO2_12_FULL_66_21]